MNGKGISIYVSLAFVGMMLAATWVSWSEEQHIRVWWWLPIQLGVGVLLFGGGLGLGAWLGLIRCDDD